MRFKVLISDGEDGWLVVECPSLPGCVSQGRTIEEALENIKDAIQGCLDVLGERVSAQQSERIVEVEA
jgi:predicted RNase H-like HicB family nuclease